MPARRPPAKTPPPPPRRPFRGVAHEERRGQRRAQLLAAGIAAFGEHGYHAVTVREICAGAKLTERYFYESFAGLEDLFVAVYRQISAELMTQTLAALASAPPEPIALAERALRVFLEFVRRDPQSARILLIDAVSISHDVQRVSSAVAGDYAGLIRRFAAQLYPDGLEGAPDIELVATGLIGANVHIATQWVREGFRTPLRQVLASNLLFYRAVAAPAVAPAKAVRKKARRS